MLSLVVSALALLVPWTAPPNSYEGRAAGIDFHARVVGRIPSKHVIVSLAGASIGKRGIIGVGSVRECGAVTLHGDLARELAEKGLKFDDMRVDDDEIRCVVNFPIAGSRELRLRPLWTSF